MENISKLSQLLNSKSDKELKDLIEKTVTIDEDHLMNFHQFTSLRLPESVLHHIGEDVVATRQIVAQLRTSMFDFYKEEYRAYYAQNFYNQVIEFTKNQEKQ